ATAIAIVLPLSIFSAVMYTSKMDIKILLGVCIGGLIGGKIGAGLLNKIPDGVLHKIFGLFMMAAAVRMIL
ncbi:MAG: TSUP family transporter, partial [Clostridiales bacterium]|nr:TSUP family transporter [Clostridiales bacterium]